MKQAQIQDENAICIVCQEGITNPICPECLAKEIKSWRPGLSKLLAEPSFGYSMDTECMFCGKEMNICAHCYSRDIYDTLVEKEPEIAEEFKELFGLRTEL